MNQEYDKLLNQIYYKQNLLSKIKLSKFQKNKIKNEASLKQTNKTKRKIVKTKLFNKNDIKSLNEILAIQKNSTSFFNNQSINILNQINSLKKQNFDYRKNIIHEIKPFLKTLNDMEIYTYNTLNSFKQNIDNLTKDNKLFELGVQKEINQLKKRLNLNIDIEDKNTEPKRIEERDIFAEDKVFLENNYNKAKINK